MKTLYPVILPVPKTWHQTTGREKVRFLSVHARAALQQSAKRCQVNLPDTKKDKDGVPLPSQGIFWSITHKPLYVAGVVAKRPIGIDIEQIRKVTPGLFKKVATPEEWRLGNQSDEMELFFRYWTSKEAVIKAQGTGIRDMLKCRIVEILNKHSVRLLFCDKEWTIEHFFFDGHLASIVRDDAKIQWLVETTTPGNR